MVKAVHVSLRCVGRKERGETGGSDQALTVLVSSQAITVKKSEPVATSIQAHKTCRAGSRLVAGESWESGGYQRAQSQLISHKSALDDASIIFRGARL